MESPRDGRGCEMGKFDNLLLLGRPASGKSELIDYLKGISDSERLKNFHIGGFEEIDDFPWLWEKFKEDDIWEKAGYPRKYSKYYGMAGNPHMSPEGVPLFDFCMEKFNIEIKKRYLSNPDFYKNKTLFIEFSRGSSSTYAGAFGRLDAEIWEKAAILFIDVTKEESWRRNVARYKEKMKHSILSHSLPREPYDYHYNTHDWPELTRGKESGYLDVKGLGIPFVTMGNEPELPAGPEIAGRYKAALGKLFELYEGRKG